MKDTDIIQRSFLIQLRDAARGMATENLNPDWARAYLALADAADRLDAMHARCTVQPQGGWNQSVPSAIEPTVEI